MKKIAFLALLFVSITAQAGEAEIRRALEGVQPGIQRLDRVSKTPYAGLYEIVIGDRLLYTDAEGKYLFNGSVIEVKTFDNLTEKRRQALFAVEFDKLPLHLALKKVKGNGKRKLAVFEDPNCGFCRRLDAELVKLDNVTIYTFLYPIFQGSDELVRNVQCAKDPVKAWDALMLDNVKPAQASCKTGTDKVLALGNKLRVSGTPTLIFANGVQLASYLPAEELEKRLVAAGE